MECMEKYKQWVIKDIPLQLYHYTTKEGFLGIIKNKQLWASHILYQNDYSEFNLALNILRETIDSNKKILQLYLVDVDTLFEDSTKWLNKSFYVVSLSEEKDILSQWRGYANSMPGFCIGFRRNYLVELKEHNNKIIIAKCIYDTAQQNTFMLELLIDSVKELGTMPENRSSTLSSQIALRILNYAPLFKHKKFEEENEWRIIIPKVYEKNDSFDIRVGRSYFVPYYKLDFKEEKAIGDVIIGPCPDKKMAYDSTLFACYANEIEFLEPGLYCLC